MKDILFIDLSNKEYKTCSLVVSRALAKNHVTHGYYQKLALLKKLALVIIMRVTFNVYELNLCTCMENIEWVVIGYED